MLFAVLASIGLMLSGLGVYGVIAYSVTQRTQEIGVRMAVGAGRRDVTWLFLRKGLMQLALALAIGLPAAIGLGVVAQFQLVEIEPTDPITIIGITIVLTAVALTACVLPARKAARVDPMVALRSECTGCRPAADQLDPNEPFFRCGLTVANPFNRERHPLLVEALANTRAGSYRGAVTRIRFRAAASLTPPSASRSSITGI